MSFAASILIPPPKLRIPRCWGPSMLTECVGEVRWRSLPAPDLTACVTSVEESSRSAEIYSQSNTRERVANWNLRFSDKELNFFARNSALPPATRNEVPPSGVMKWITPLFATIPLSPEIIKVITS